MSETKLGVLLDETAKRDAIHVALAPVVAGETLMPGQHVGFIPEDPERRVGRRGDHIGIIDPYLTEHVQPNQRFWLFLYQNTVTSLRHQWTHPAFPEAEFQPPAVRTTSEQWLRDFAEEVGVSYGVLMGAAETWLLTDNGKWGGEYHVLSYDTPDVVHKKKAEMWHHYEIVTGKKVANHEATFFTCSC